MVRFVLSSSLKYSTKIGALHLLKLLLRYTIFEKSFIKSVFDGKLIVNALTKRYYYLEI